MLRARRRLRLGVRGLILIVAVLAVPLWFLRLLRDPWVTVATRLELVYDPSVPAPDWTGRWTEAEAILRSSDVIAEALAGLPGPQTRDIPEEALRRLILGHGTEKETNLPIHLQMRSSVSVSRADRVFLDGVVRAFARRYRRGRIVQSYPARAYTAGHYGGMESMGFIASSFIAAGIIFAVLRRGGAPARPPC
jgi:hypothetical protein